MTYHKRSRFSCFHCHRVLLLITSIAIQLSDYWYFNCPVWFFCRHFLVQDKMRALGSRVHFQYQFLSAWAGYLVCRLSALLHPSTATFDNIVLHSQIPMDFLDQEGTGCEMLNFVRLKLKVSLNILGLGFIKVVV